MLATGPRGRDGAHIERGSWPRGAVPLRSLPTSLLLRARAGRAHPAADAFVRDAFDVDGPLAVLGLAATGVFGALRYWHVARHEFAGVSRALTLQGAGRAGASVAFGLAGGGWAGLVLGDLAGRLVGIRRPGSGRAATSATSRAHSGGGPSRRLREARRFPLVVLPSSVLDALAAALPIPVIATLFGPRRQASSRWCGESRPFLPR